MVTVELLATKLSSFDTPNRVFTCEQKTSVYYDFSRPSGPFAPQLDMVHNPAVGLQGPHYLRSSLMEHRDQNARPLIRRILDVSFERLQTLQNKDDRRQEILQILCSWLRIRSTFPVKFSSKKIKCTGGISGFIFQPSKISCLVITLKNVKYSCSCRRLQLDIV
jgi:hypothetical protein